MKPGQMQTGEPETPRARLDAWVAAAQPGARHVYRTGYHAYARDGDRLAAQLAARAVAERCHALAMAGLVLLVQARVPGEGFDYIAIRSGRALPGSWPKLPPPDAVGGARVVAPRAVLSGDALDRQIAAAFA